MSELHGSWSKGFEFEIQNTNKDTIGNTADTGNPDRCTMLMNCLDGHEWPASSIPNDFLMPSWLFCIMYSSNIQQSNIFLDKIIIMQDNNNDKKDFVSPKMTVPWSFSHHSNLNYIMEKEGITVEEDNNKDGDVLTEILVATNLEEDGKYKNNGLDNDEESLDPLIIGNYYFKSYLFYQCGR